MNEVLKITFAVAAFVAFLIGTAPYILSVRRGITNPHKVSVIIFLILGFMNIGSQFAEGATSSLVFPFITVFVNVSILLLMKSSKIGAINRIDKVSFVLAMLILVAWYITNSAALAIVLLTVVNIIAKVLIAKKVFNYPYSEPIFAYSFWIIGSIFTVLSVGEIDWILMLPALNNIVTLLLIIAIIVYRRKKTINKISTLA